MELTREQLLARYPNASESFLRANACDFRGDVAIPARDMDHGVSTPSAQTQGRKRLRQRTGPKLNKTEAAFLEFLRVGFPGDVILQQFPTLPLANGTKYTPDFCRVVVHGHRVQLFAYEVKGFMRDDAGVKLKVGAALFPWILFALVWRDGRTGPWNFQEIRP